MKNVTLLISFLILHSISNLSAQSIDSLIQLGKNKCFEQPDSALLLFDMALDIQPKNKAAINAKVNCLLSTNQFDKASSFVTDLITSDTTSAEYYFMRGTIKNNQSYPDSSCLLDYYRAIQINPNYFDALYNISVYYFNMAVEIKERLKLQSDISETLIEKRKYYLSRAMTFMEKANNLNSDKYTQQTLLFLYTELNLTEKKKELELKMNNNNR